MPEEKRGTPIKNKIKWLALDALFIGIGLLISVEFYFSLSVSQARIMQMSRTLPLLLVMTLGALWVSGIYKSLLRYAGTDTFFEAAVATLAGTGTTYLISLIISLFCREYEDAIGMRLVLMPRPVYFIQWVITLFLIIGSRYLVKIRSGGNGFLRNRSGRKILVIGAGYAGAAVIRDI